MTRSVGFLALGAWLALSVGCGPDEASRAFPDQGHGAGEAGSDHEVEVGDHGPSDFPDVPAGQVDDFAVTGVLRSIPAAEAVEAEGPGGEPFRVALRTPEIGHFPCTSCHVRPIGQKAEALMQMHGPRAEHEGATRVECSRCHDPTRPGAYVLDCAGCHEREGRRELMPSRTAHLTVKLSHPGGIYRNCLTCHSPDNPGMLVLREGTQASLDQAYLLCRGCHFLQGEDWANGAHGKRLGGWAGERTILSCTGCHNPHDPRFPVRRPVTFPKIARPGGGP
ncbi:MAG TPA: hypothetical protein VK858_07980 [Longimicrobiales bacterium]|nr:hypothetical protein [Longimicrobiales bacterium]